MRTADAILSLAFLALCHCSLNPQPLPPDTAGDSGADFATLPGSDVDAGNKAGTTGMGGSTSSSSSGSLTEADAGDVQGATADGGHGEDGASNAAADAAVDAGPDGAAPPPPGDGGTMRDGATTDAPLTHDGAEEARVGHDATL